MTQLWTAWEAAQATGGDALGWAAVSGIAIDTRSLRPGDLFVALQGEARDGHAFVADALAKGAAAAMVSHWPEGLAQNAPLLVVDDTLRALERLAGAARARSRAKVVAVTGSVGKTSTKDMLRAMLAAQGNVHAAERSFNNHWGLPLTLARMPAETDFAVLEIGMNHAGEIGPLARLARPHVAVITTVEAVHSAAFASVEQIADAKAEIFQGLEPGGVAILNADNPHFTRLAAATGGAAIRRFGTGEADVRLLNITLVQGVTVVSAELSGRPVLFKIGAPGTHMAMNACAALAAICALGADPARAALALADWAPLDGRGKHHRILRGPAGLDGVITLIDDSYNANPASVQAAIAVLGAEPVTHGIGRVTKGRRIAFLGDMLELGEAETALHAGLAALPEIEGIDLFHCCGPLMRHFHQALPHKKRGEWFATSQELAAKARRVVDGGDVCMVKGSNGMAMRHVVEAILSLGTSAAESLEDA